MIAIIWGENTHNKLEINRQLSSDGSEGRQILLMTHSKAA